MDISNLNSKFNPAMTALLFLCVSREGCYSARFSREEAERRILLVLSNIGVYGNEATLKVMDSTKEATWCGIKSEEVTHWNYVVVFDPTATESSKRAVYAAGMGFRYAYFMKGL